MAKLNKPNSVNTIWADSALDTNIEKPADSYILEGWTQVKPPYEYENWSMNKLHWGLAYYNQLGIPEWDSMTEYQAYKSYVQASDNRVYRCIQTHSDRNPASGNTAYWEVYEGNRQATTSARGTVELATNNEVVEGSRSDLAVTPLALQNKKASTTQEGIIRTATNSEVSQGSLNNVAITPATLQFRTATTSQPGLVELATAQEAQEGVRNDIALTPESIVGIGQMFFPVGSVIMRPTNPGNTIANGGLGFGTWQKISGRSIIGDGSYTDDSGKNRSFVAGNSEGEYEHRLSTQELPSHNHSASSGAAGNHSHSVSGSTSSDGNHNHTGSIGSAGNHIHSLSINGSGSHSHSGYTSSGGNHSHAVYANDGESLGQSWWLAAASDAKESYGPSYTEDAGDHNHSLDIRNAGNHSHSGSANANGTHTHSISINSNGSHTHNVSGSTNTLGSHTHSISVSSTGGNNPHNNTHPVFVAPIWYRTA